MHRSGSERTYKEQKLLNDTWISCPSGSEQFNAGVSNDIGGDDATVIIVIIIIAYRYGSFTDIHDNIQYLSLSLLIHTPEQTSLAIAFPS